MEELNIIVHHKVGLHARPAAIFVKTASGFKSDIHVIAGERNGNAKSILSVLQLGVSQGTPITIRASGPDESEAIQALKQLIESNFGEPE